MPPFKVLLDEGFPRLPVSMMSALDRTVSVEHLYDFDKKLVGAGTPDWFLYARAAESGFSVLATRDFAQVSQPAEMFMLSRLSTLTVVTWRGGVEDAVREWGQLLAYLPLIRGPKCLGNLLGSLVA